jgi:hypothetical protein
MGPCVTLPDVATVLRRAYEAGDNRAVAGRRASHLGASPPPEAIDRPRSMGMVFRARTSLDPMNFATFVHFNIIKTTYRQRVRPTK